MTLTLKILNRDRLENGSPTELVLHSRGAIIGRSATCEWPLPDDGRALSRNHCVIKFQDDCYILEDTSTNGTFFGNDNTPLTEPHRIKPHDVFKLGAFQIEARLGGNALACYNRDFETEADPSGGTAWGDWGEGSEPKPIAASTDQDAFAAPIDDSWGIEDNQAENVSAWADKADAKPSGPTPDEIFNTLSNNHEVDWNVAAWDVEDDFDAFSTDEAAFDSPSDPFGSLPTRAEDSHDATPASTSDATDWQPDQSFSEGPNAAPQVQQTSDSFGSLGMAAPANVVNHIASPLSPAASAAATPQPSPTYSPETAQASVQVPDIYRNLLTSMGVSSTNLTTSPEETAERAGRLLRRLLAGLMTLLEARTRAKDAMGTATTQLRLDGNNPLKFARDIDQALQMVMNPARPGYMEFDLAVEDSYRDLQAHQIATIKAMQGALKATLERFSPETIKTKAKSDGLLSKILPGQREAALWRAYEEQFNGSVQGSAEAFFDTFSAEFSKAYEDASRQN